jgi:hypothetical protein
MFALIIVAIVNIILGALVLIASGLFCFLLSIQTKKDIAKIKATQTLKVQDITKLCNTVKQEIGSEGYFSTPVAVQGTKKIGNNFGGDQFYVEDDTGEILVKLDHLTSNMYNKRKPLTSATFSVKNLLSLATDNNRNPLLRDNEPTSSQVLKPVKRPIYVMGEACDTYGELMIKKSFNNNESFVVIFKSKKQYIQQKKSRFKWLIATGVFLIFLGIGWIVTAVQTAMGL